MPEVGVFAFRGRVRPNPIGLTVCRLLEVRGCYLKVVGLDAYPGTPILDIKPYDYYDIVENPAVPEWFLRLWRERDSQPSP
jgi:tRNA (Thr-GGU) A37 N-methylase